MRQTSRSSDRKSSSASIARPSSPRPTVRPASSIARSYNFGVDGCPAYISGHIVDIRRVMLDQALSKGVRRGF